MTPAGQAALRAELERDEGLRLTAYQDGGGVWTIGYGHTGPEVHAGLTWTQAKAEQQLAADIARVEMALNARAPWWTKLNDARQAVLVDMAFNLGMSGLLSFHHTIAATEAGAYAAAAADMLATEPWRSQVGARAERLALQIRTGAFVAD